MSENWELKYYRECQEAEKIISNLEFEKQCLEEELKKIKLKCFEFKNKIVFLEFDNKSLRVNRK